jgi:hydrogenase maturation protein HypF
MPIRRLHGYVPQPLRLPWALAQPVLACGAELKNSICVAKGRYAFLSHHLGDLENYQVFQSFTEAIGHFQRLFDVHPRVVAYDLHPEYLSTKLTVRLFWKLIRRFGSLVSSELTS